MIASESGRGCRAVTTGARVPRVGVAPATSTMEASCTPTSTPSSSHCTSPSTSCLAHAVGQDGDPSSPMPSWSAWRSPRSCSGSAPSAAGCGLLASGWGHLFPYLPTASAYNRRLRRAAPLVCLAIQDIAAHTPSWCDQLRLVDSTPLPCAASRETVKRSELAGHAGYGYCKSHHRYFWGFRLYLTAAPDGMPIIWGLANPKPRRAGSHPRSARTRH